MVILLVLGSQRGVGPCGLQASQPSLGSSSPVKDLVALNKTKQNNPKTEWCLRNNTGGCALASTQVCMHACVYTLHHTHLWTAEASVIRSYFLHLRILRLQGDEKGAWLVMYVLHLWPEEFMVEWECDPGPLTWIAVVDWKIIFQRSVYVLIPRTCKHHLIGEKVFGDN